MQREGERAQFVHAQISDPATDHSHAPLLIIAQAIICFNVAWGWESSEIVESRQVFQPGPYLQITVRARSRHLHLKSL